MTARKLHKAQREVTVLLLADPAEVKGDAAEMMARVPVPVLQMSDPAGLQPYLALTDLIVDAILGTGFRPPVTGLYAAAIGAINAAVAPVLAVDIPSGADADAFTAADSLRARADAVVTFTAPRPAHVFAELTSGETLVAPIGSPDGAITSELNLYLTTPLDFVTLLAVRDRAGNKGNYGHVLIVGGSVGKAGAAAMAGMGALRAGAGLATVATAQTALPMVAGFAPELMTEPLAATDAGTISLVAREYGRMDAVTAGKDVIAIGPGISRHSDTVQFVRAVVDKYRVLTIVDADGLNAFEGCAERLNGQRRPLVITPHPGEMARLTGLSVGDIQRDRIAIARRFAREHYAIVVLKGHRTLVAHPDGEVWANPTGNPGMASGGTGDVLTGIIAGMAAQHVDRVFLAVLAAVYLHGLAGDIASERLGEESMIATDLLDNLPDAFRRARTQSAEPTFTFHA